MKSLTSFAYKTLTALMIVMLALTAVPVSPAYADSTAALVPSANANNGWNNPQNAYVADNNRAVADSGNDDVQYYNFNFPVFPAGVVITGIEVLIEGYNDGGGTPRQAYVSLSSNGGTSFTTGTGTGVKTTNMPGNNAGAEAVRTFGSATDTWNRTWVPGDFTNNFRVRLDVILANNNLYIDQVRVIVYYSQPTNTTLGSSQNPSIFGQLVTFTATVAPAAAGGTVTFMDGATSLGSGVVSGGVATLITGALTGGSHNITAVYSGNSTYATSTSAPLAQIVNKANTTTTITNAAALGTDTVVGQPYAVTYSVAVIAPGSGTPGGNVTVSDGTSTCSGTVAAGTCNLASMTAGAKTITATYVGDVNFNTSTSAGVAHTVNKANTTISITSDNLDPSIVGQNVAVNFTVVAVAPGAGTRTGNVTVTDSVDAVTCTGAVAVAGTGSCNLALTTPGAHTLTATYPGDPNYNGSASAGAAHTVNQVPAITSANNTTFAVGTAGTFTVTATGYPTPALARTGGTLPTGVTLIDNGDGTATLSGTPAAGTGGSYTLTFTASNTAGNTPQTFTLNINQAPVITSAAATTFNVGAVGSFTVTRTGFPAANIAMTGALPGGVTFNPATRVLAGTPNVGTVGTYPLVFTASNGVTPDYVQNFVLTVGLGGNVITFNQPTSPAGFGTTFTVNPTASSGLTVSVAVVPNVPATVPPTGCTIAGNVVTMTSGTVPCRLTASQAGNASYVAAADVTRTVAAQRATTTVSVVPDPSQSSYSHPMTFTVTVTSPGGIPTGTVTLSGGSPNQSITATLDALGTTQITSTNLVVVFLLGPVPHGTIFTGTDPLRFTYNGDANFNTDWEETSHTVYPAPTEVDVTSNINPSAQGQLVTFTVTISTIAPGIGIPPGTVVLYDGATPISGVLTLTNGVATFSTSALTYGAHSISAQYTSTSNNYATSNNTALPYTHNVRRATTTVLTSNNNASDYGEDVTFTANVTSTTPGTLTGTVKFYDGATLLNTGTLSGGVVSFTTNALIVGTHPITAVYSGDGFYATSTSAVLNQVVNQAVLTVTATNQIITYGDSDPNPFPFTYSGFAPGEDATVIDTPPTCSAPTPHVNMGNYPGIIECSGGADNYYSFVYENGDLRVDPKALTITADNRSKTYGTLYTFLGTEFTATGLVPGDTVTSATLSSTGSPTSAPASPPTYPILISNAVGTGLGNYTITYVPGTMTVAVNALTLVATNQTKTYGDVYTFVGTLVSGEFTVVGTLQPGDSITSVTLTSAGAPSAADVSSYSIVITPGSAVGSGLSNYSISYANGQMTVTPRDLTYTPDDQTKVYGEEFTAYTGAFTGLRVGDAIAPVFTSPGAAVTATVAGSPYPITVTLSDPGGKLGNYNVADPLPTASLTVTPQPISVTPANRSKVYGDTLTPADFSGAIMGIKNGDNITATYYSPLGAPATAIVGTYDIEATLVDPDGMLGNYAITRNTGTLTVTRRDLDVTSDSRSKVYGEALTAIDFTGSVLGLQNGDVITSTYDSTGALATAPFGSYDITVLPLIDSGSKLPNYHVIYHIGKLSVGRQDLVVTPTNRSKVYGDALTPADFSGVVTGLQNGDAITPIYASPGALATATVAGSTYPITVTLSDPTNKLGNYNFTLNTGELTVTKRDLVVDPDDKSKIFGQWFTDFTGVITGIQNGENITANYASAGSPPSAAVGSYNITPTLNDPTGKLGNYNFVPHTGTLTVGASVLTVRADDKTIAYGDPDPTFSFIYSGFMGTDTPSVINTPPTCNVSGAHTAVNTYTIACSGAADDNYSFVYVPGTLTVTKRALVVTPIDKIKTYGNVFSAFTGVISGIQFGDNITATYASIDGAPATAPVGDYDITASLVDPDSKLVNYTFTLNTGTLSVIERDLTITPDNKTKLYGDEFTAFTGSVNGIQNGDPIIVTYSSPLGAPATATVAGSPYPIIVGLSAPASVLDNYNITPNQGSLTVTQRPLIVTPDNKSKVYGTEFTSFTGTIVGIQNSENITATYASDGGPATADVGTYAITANLLDPSGKLGNYAVTLKDGTLVVGLSVLTVTADNKTIIYGDPDPVFTFAYTGFNGSDTASVIDTPPTCMVSVLHNNIGPYSITCSGGVDDNYSFSYLPGTLTVDPRVLTVTPADKSKLYGDEFTAFTGVVSGLQSGDNITVTYASSGAPATAGVGTYDITAALVDPGNRQVNYIVNLNMGTLTVNKRSLTVTPDNRNKVYGSSFTAFTGSVLGIQNSDAVTVNYASDGAATTAAVGTYDITAAVSSVTPAILLNYNITTNMGTLTVGQRDLVVTPADKTKVYGEVFTTFSGTITGIQPGDTIIANYVSSGAGSSALIGDHDIIVTLTSIPANVLDNYNVIANLGTLTVTKRQLTVTPDNKAKVFGTVFTDFTGVVVGLRAGDNITPIYASDGAAADAAVGNHSITVTLDDPDGKLSNYTTTLNDGTLAVGLSVLTVRAENKTIIYGDTDPVFTFTYTGFTGSDTASDIDTPPTCTVSAAHNNIGTYSIACSGGVDNSYSFSYLTGTLTVDPRALTVTPANKSKVYGDTFTAFTGTVIGLQSGDGITVTYDSPGALATAAVNTYDITADLNDPGSRLGNYILTRNIGTLTVTKRSMSVTPDNKNKVYGSLFDAFTGSVVGVQNSDLFTITYDSAGAPVTAVVGAHSITTNITATPAVLANYNITPNTGILTVGQRDLVVTPADKTKVYGDVFSAFTGTVTGTQNGDIINVGYASPGTASVAIVGDHDITATLTALPGVLDNYNVISNLGTLTVTKRQLTVTPDNKAKVFGTVFTDFTGVVVGLRAGDNITPIYASAGAAADAIVGNHSITVTLDDPDSKLSNYTTTLNDGTLTVGLSILTVRAENKTIIYGDADPVFTFTYTGFTGSDTASDIDTPPTCTVSAAHNNIGTYSIACSGGVDNSYSFSYLPGTLTVNPRVLTVTPANKSKVYGDVFSAYTASVVGLQPSDNITLAYDSLGAPATAVVGTHDITVALVDPGGRQGNYLVTLNRGTLTVTRRALTITPTDTSKIYGSTFSAFTGTIEGIQNGNAITANYSSSGSAATATVGSYSIIAAVNATPAILANYNLTTNTGTLNVTKRDLVVQPADKTKIFGTTFSAFTGSLVGIQNGDNITATYTSAGAPASAVVGSYDITTVTPLIDPTNKLPNYNVSTTDIATLTVTLSNQTITVVTSAPGNAANNAEFTVAATASSGEDVTYTSSGVCSNVGDRFTITSPSGICVVHYNQSGTPDYNPAPEVTENVTALPNSQTITVSVHAPTVSSLGSSFDVEAGASSGLIVSIAAAGSCSIDDHENGTATITITAANGKCTIYYTQEGDATYASAPKVTEVTTLDSVAPTVTVNQETAQLDPTNSSPINFTVVFSEPVIGFTDSDIVIEGAAGATTAVVTESAPNDGTIYNVAISGMKIDGTVIVSVPAAAVEDVAGNDSFASSSTDNTVTYFDGVGPTVQMVSTAPDTGDGALKESEKVVINITHFKVTFNQDVYNPEGDSDPDDVTNPNNYILVRDLGETAGFQTVSCNLGAVIPADTNIAIGTVIYDSATATATFTINGNLPLSNGSYRLYVCGTTSIVDPLNITLGLVGSSGQPNSDYLHNFTVNVPSEGGGGGAGNQSRGGSSKKDSANQAPSSLLIPVTGFAPGQVTRLPVQPADQVYQSLDEIRIEIPTLGINFPIVGVSLSGGQWNLTWLKDSVGYLEGSAYPTFNGNTVLTAHVIDANNNLGPFSDIKGMQLNDKIYIHAYGKIYVYQVQENRKVSPANISTVFKHQEYSWVTLVTCEDYDAESGLYNYRRMVRAVLISVVIVE